MCCETFAQTWRMSYNDRADVQYISINPRGHSPTVQLPFLAILIFCMHCILLSRC